MRTVWAGVVVALGLVLGACGGDDESASDSDSARKGQSDAAADAAAAAGDAGTLERDAASAADGSAAADAALERDAAVVEDAAASDAAVPHEPLTFFDGRSVGLMPVGQDHYADYLHRRLAIVLTVAPSRVEAQADVTRCHDGVHEYVTAEQIAQGVWRMYLAQGDWVQLRFDVGLEKPLSADVFYQYEQRDGQWTVFEAPATAWWGGC